MKNKLFYLLIAPFLLTGFTCNDDQEEIRELTISRSSTPLKLGKNRTISITDGNGDYLVISDNEEIATAKIIGDSIIISPEKIGRTNIRLKDKYGKQAEMSVTVENPYLLFKIQANVADVNAKNLTAKKAISDDVLRNTSLQNGSIYEFIANEKKTVRVYDSEEDLITNTYTTEGNFSLNESNRSLTITYGKRNYTYTMYGAYADFVFNYFSPLQITATEPSDPITIELGKDFTEKYKAKYPDAGIEYARLKIVTTLVPYK